MATAIQAIPTHERAFYSQRARLDERDYTMRFQWNQRAGRWFFSLFDAEDEPILQGVKLVANFPILRYWHHDPRCPAGELWVHDLTGDGSPPGFEELGIGKRCELAYHALAEQV